MLWLSLPLPRLILVLISLQNNQVLLLFYEQISICLDIAVDTKAPDKREVINSRNSKSRTRANSPTVVSLSKLPNSGNRPFSFLEVSVWSFGPLAVISSFRERCREVWKRNWDFTQHTIFSYACVPKRTVLRLPHYM